MTREEAISILSRPITMKNVPSDILKAHEVAIKALEQEPCEDAISRKDAINAMSNALERVFPEHRDIAETVMNKLPSVSTENSNRLEIKQKCDRINSIASVLPYAPHREIQELLCEIMDMSSVSTEKTGRWISFRTQGEIDGQIVRAFTCSKCGAISVFRMIDGKIVNGDSCVNCGAKMEVEDG